MNDHTYFSDYAIPIGDTVRELLKARGLTQKDLALALSRPEKTISEVLNGKARLTPETAIQLEHFFGKPAEFWANLDANYWIAKRRTPSLPDSIMHPTEGCEYCHNCAPHTEHKMLTPRKEHQPS